MMDNKIFKMPRVTVCIFLLFLSIIICLGLLYTRENSYNNMMMLIEKGDLKAALRKCKSPLMRGQGKQKLEILEATFYLDVNKTLNAIENDICYSKCFHVIEDWKKMILPYLESQINGLDKHDIIAYIEEIEVCLNDEIGLVINLLGD